VGALVALAVLAWGNDVRAAAPEQTAGAYKLTVNLDVPLLLIAGGSAAGFLFMNETAPPACAPLCNKDNVNPVDRPFAGMYSHSWQVTGDIATAATLVLVPAGLIIGEPNRYVWGDLLVVGEAVLVTSALQVPLSYALGRPRPRVYGTEAPLDERDDAGGHFPSDVVVGAAVGAGVGLMIPALHDQQLQVQPIAGPQTGGVAIAGMWR
jgi:hypothetical protein